MAIPDGGSTGQLAFTALAVLSNSVLQQLLLYPEEAPALAARAGDQRRDPAAGAAGAAGARVRAAAGTPPLLPPPLLLPPLLLPPLLPPLPRPLPWPPGLQEALRLAMGPALAQSGPVLALAERGAGSSLQLTNSEVTPENKSVDPCYDPFENRQNKTVSDAGAMAHLLKGCLGTGILAMPSAFRNSGLLLGSIFTLLVGLVCTHCVAMLVAASHMLCRRTQQPQLSYADTAEAAFASGAAGFRRYSAAARIFVNIGLCVTYYGTAVVYVVFVATSVKQIADYYTENSSLLLDVRLYMVMLIIPLCLLCSIPKLKYLVPFSTAANLFILVSFSITLYYIFTNIPSPTERRLTAPLGQLPLFFSTVIFALEGVGVVMPVENSMKNPQRFLGCPGILNFSMAIIVALYAVIGFFGYVKYGEDTLGSVTLNLPTEDLLAQVVKVLIALAVFFTYALQIYVPNEIAWTSCRALCPAKWRGLGEVCFKSVVVVLTVAVAAAVPNLSPIIALVGAVGLSTLGLLCPAVIDSVARWQQASPLRHLKNAAIGAFSLLALCAGAYTSIVDIINDYL